MPPPGNRFKTRSFVNRRVEMSCCKKVAKALFSHLGLLIIVILYAVIGAYLFINIEIGAEEKRREAKRRESLDMEDALNYIIKKFYYHNFLNETKAEHSKMVHKNLETFHSFVVKKAQNSDLQYDGKVNTWEYDWTLPKSLLFTMTTISAIGYGHIAPKTGLGRTVLILYSVVGIPLLLLFLANIGDFLARSLRYVYSRLCCRWCRIVRRKGELKKNQNLEKKILRSDIVGEESYMPTDMVDVPIVINLCLIAVYLTLGGALFSWWEGWQLYSAIYFTLITLTTIGFGDLVPGGSFLSYESGVDAAMKMVVTMVYCLFGMALLSMCINLMQEQLVMKSRWLAKEMGISSEKEDPTVKYKIKKSKEGTVMETPWDRDGNNRLSGQWNRPFSATSHGDVVLSDIRA